MGKPCLHLSNIIMGGGQGQFCQFFQFKKSQKTQFVDNLPILKHWKQILKLLNIICKPKTMGRTIYNVWYTKSKISK
jgi:hypothetical protein